MSLADRLRAAYEPGEGIDAVVIERRVARRRSRRRITVVAGLVLVVGLAVVAGVQLASDRSSELATQGSGDESDTSGLVPVETGLTLVFDDGVSGLVAVDVDGGLAQRRSYEQKPSGDHDVRLARVGDRIVWPGRPDTWSVPASLEADPVALGEGFVIVPAGDGESVWLIADAAGDSHQFGTPLEATLVDAAGNLLVPTTPFPEPAGAGDTVTGGPQGGNRQGLWLQAVQFDDIGQPVNQPEHRFWIPGQGLTDWTSSSQCVGGGAGDYLVARGPQRPRSTTDPTAPAGCVDLTVVRVDGSGEIHYDSGTYQAVLSDDQRWTALVSSTGITVHETATGDQVAEIEAPENPEPEDGPYWLTSQVAWSPDGQWLVAATPRAAPYEADSQVALSFLNVDTGASYATTVALGPLGQFVVVDRSHGPAFGDGSAAPPCKVTEREVRWGPWPGIQDAPCRVNAPDPASLPSDELATATTGATQPPTAEPTSNAPEDCDRAARAYSGETEGGFESTAAEVRGRYSNAAIEALPESYPVSLCYIAGTVAKSPPPEPGGTSPPPYDRLVVAVTQDGSVVLLVAGYRDLLPIEPP